MINVFYYVSLTLAIATEPYDTQIISRVLYPRHRYRTL